MRKRKTNMKILHLDIETAPNLVYTWGLYRQNIGINQIVKPAHMLCWAAKWHGKRGSYFASLQDKTQKEMLQELWDLLDEADAVCHYNGTKFDIPRIQQEFQLHGMGMPSPFQEIDLLKTVRKRFGLPSNKLDYVAQYFGLGKKIKHAGMELWIGCMNGVAKCWKKMERYNKGDVRLLEKLYNFLLPVIKGHPNVALFDMSDGCNACGSTNLQKRGLTRTKCLIYQRYRCMNCGKWMRSKTSVTPQGIGTMRG